ncbi:hypothetical protein [Streptomyces xiamenensis]|uniref:hypothetical protein n=1 Tax=Streptomyces xiamenensis TaxID=408015 RepID=UPI0037D204AE
MTATATQQQPRTSFRRRRIQALAGLAAVTLAMGALTACGEDKPTKNEEAASPADSDTTQEETPDEETAEDDAAAGAGSDYFTVDDMAVWEESGIEISAEAPEAFTPGEYAFVEAEEYDAYTVEFTLTNTGTERLETAFIMPFAYDENGIEVEDIYDGDIGMGFQSKVDPGVTVTAEYGFALPPGSTSFTVEISDLLDEEAVWKFEL